MKLDVFAIYFGGFAIYLEDIDTLCWLEFLEAYYDALALTLPYLVNLATLWSLDHDALVLVDILEDLVYGALHLEMTLG